MPGKRHTPLDWVGLFKVIASGNGGAGGAVDAFHKSTHSAVSTPASRRARQKAREDEAKKRRREGGEPDAMASVAATPTTASPARTSSPSRRS